MIRLRLIGTADEVDIALHRLRDVFTKVTASEPLPCREVHGQVRVYVEATFQAHPGGRQQVGQFDPPAEVTATSSGLPVSGTEPPGRPDPRPPGPAIPTVPPRPQTPAPLRHH